MRAILQAGFLGLILSLGAIAQSSPDCTQTFSFTSATAGTAFSNKPTTTGGTPCAYWIFDYFTNGASGVSVKLEGAADVAGASSGSYTALTAASGTSNPATGTTQGGAILCCDYYPWLRINPTTFSGTNQTMIVRLYGWRTQPVNSGGSSVGTNVNVAQWGGTSTTLGQKLMASSVPVALASDQSAIPVTPAANSSVNLAQVGATTVLTGGVAGSQGVGGLAAAGAAPSGNPVPEGQRDSSGNIIIPTRCTLSAAVNLSGSGNTQIVALSGSTVIRICHISLSATQAEDIKITYGTGSNCASGTTDLSGLYKTVQSFALDFNMGALQAPAGQAICVNQSLAIATGVTVLYAQY